MGEFPAEGASYGPDGFASPWESHDFYAEALPALDLLRAGCPYHSWKMDKNLVSDQAEGPSAQDQYAFWYAANAGGIQGKAQGFASSRQKMLPYGLPPQLHHALSEELVAPLAGDPEIAQDMRFCAEVIMEQGPQRIHEWRSKQWRKLTHAFSSLTSFKEALLQKQCWTSKAVSRHICPMVHEAARYSTQWPDISSTIDLLEAHQITGSLPRFGIYRDAKSKDLAEEPPTILGNEEFVQQCLRRPPPPDEEARIVWDKSNAEKELGILLGFWTKGEVDAFFGRGNWRCMQRFAIFQDNHGAWRCIDNGKAGGQNIMTKSGERIHTTCHEVFFAFAKVLRAFHGTPLTDDALLLSTTMDMKRAYRQLGVRPDQLSSSVIMLWSPVSKSWVFAVLLGLAFGLKSAVLQFNRLPSLMACVMRRWLAIPAAHFFDDFKWVEPAFSAQSGLKFADLLIKAWGVLFDADKRHTLQSSGVFLGICEDYGSKAMSDIVLLAPTMAREKLLKATLTLFRTRLTACGSEMCSLAGRLMSNSIVFVGKLGKVLLHPLYAFVEEHGHGGKEQKALSERVLHCLAYHSMLLEI